MKCTVKQYVPKLFVQINIGDREHQNKYISLRYMWSLMAISDARDNYHRKSFSKLIYSSGIHRNCSNARPLACMHAVHHWTIDCRVRSKIPGMSAMVPATMVILATRFSSVYTTVSYTSCFMCPQGKESRLVRWADLGGQATGSPRPILRFPKVTLR